ncbi:MAG: hypothetical protein ACT4O1_04265, partial [Gemmatimonadota bacterium]
ALVSTADGTVLRTGTFGQKLFAVRPAIGAGDRFQAGLTFMQVRDDVGSIPDIRVPSSATNPERSANSPPKDNLVAGFDLTFRFVGGRIMAQYANGVSLLANDISTGPLTEAGLDSIADAAGIGRIGIDPSKYRDYFILNSSVIPLDPRALTNVAHQARTSLRVGTHTLGAEWYSIGGSYYSLGYTALQRDRRGIRVYDSFTLINNSLVAAAGYDRDRDNLDESKLATTTSSGMFANLSWQQSRDAVLLSVSARVGSRLNNLPSTQAEAIDETNQAFSAAVGLPLGRFAGLRTRLNLNAAFIDRSDPANADADTRDTYYLGGIQAETAERTSDFSVAYGINRTEFGGTSGTDFGRLLVSGRRQLATGIAALIDVSRVAASSDATSTFPIDYNRLELIGGGEFEVIRSTLLTVNAGVISYSDGRDSSLDTKETIARVSLRRAF